ncbi:MAG: Lar family restriction alleviation protein [Firmicutes bacterium]|nr:Lar family restriction alleviation protein [Bacillota bacterium]MCR4712716.1 Lar family restriction alleviation protein [Clostridia bacterium]
MSDLLNIYQKLTLLDCPCCGGTGVLEEENGWCWYAVCMDCGAQTGSFEYRDEAGRYAAAAQAAKIWNMGKVISPAPGE